MKLSLLIPTIKRHDKYFTLLKFELYAQMLPYEGQVELLYDDAESDPIGTKRNRLLERATGTHLAFIDADDRVVNNYISLLMDGIEKNVDCCSLKGLITTNGNDPHYFEHSIKYSAYETVEGTSFDKGEIHYLRYPNHISCIRSEIAKQFKFPDTSWSEDTDWATQIYNSGLLKTEHYIEDVIYFYDYKTK